MSNSGPVSRPDPLPSPAAAPWSRVPARLHIVGFVGHRELPAQADHPALRASLRTALRELLTITSDPVVARTGAGPGADQLFLAVCRELHVPYAVVLPQPPARLEATCADPATWAATEAHLDAAHSLEIVPGNETGAAVHHLTARAILDVADRMLVVWNGDTTDQLGSTAESVRETRERGLPLRILDATTGAMAGWEAPSAPLDAAPRRAHRPATAEPLPVAPDVPTLFQLLDQRATAAAPRSRWFSAGSISLHQAATLVYAVLAGLSLNMESARAIKFMIVSTAAFLPLIGRRLHLRDAWTVNRRRAELLRSLLASHAFAPPLRPFCAELFVDDLPLLRAAGWHLAQRHIPWETARDTYLTERLDDQIAYLQRAGARAQLRLHRLELCFKISAYSATTLSALAIVVKLAAWPLPTVPHALFFRFLPIALPALAAWCMAMISVFEHKRRARLYHRIAEQLTDLRKRLHYARTYTTAANLVGLSERLLLTELWEWGGKPGK